MKSRERYTLTAFGFAAARAAAAAMLALVHLGLNPSPPTAEPLYAQANISIAARGSTPVQAGPTDRFAYVSFQVVPLLLPPPADQLPRATKLEPEDPQSWFAETRQETTPHSDVRPSGPARQSLPWQTTTPVMAPPVYTLKERLTGISPAANKRLAEKFQTANAVWPPTEITLIAIKDEKTLELFARTNGGAWKLIHRYRVLAASGKAGPKLRQGDQQVPEGVYGISFLNPNSRYHVSLRVNYPNAFDRQMAVKDGRHDLGGDIMIHGKNVSVGCLAVGDLVAEELFVLAANVGLPNVKLIIAPTDFRRDGFPTAEPGQRPWLPELYTEVESAMSEFKPPPSTGLLSFFWN